MRFIVRLIILAINYPSTPDPHPRITRNTSKFQLKMYKNDAKQIVRAVGTRTIAQVRYHPQKFVPRLESKRKTLRRTSQNTQSSTNKGGSPAYQAWLYHSMSASYLFQMMQMEASVQNSNIPDDVDKTKAGFKDSVLQ